MSKMVALPSLVPRYVGRFSCIGGACEDTCCSGWRVDLDQISFMSYQACPDPVLKPLFEKYLQRTPGGGTRNRYGTLEKPAGSCQDCPFLDPDRLCRIQARLGEAALSDTCATYPRITLHFSDFHQTILQLSCPEAARLALLAPDAFELEAGEILVRPESVIPVGPRSGLDPVAMDAIRCDLYRILDDGELDLSQRLALIGFTCKQLSEFLADPESGSLEELRATMAALASTGEVAELLGSQQDRHHAQIRFSWYFLLALQLSDLSAHQRRVIGPVATLSPRPDGSLDEVRLIQTLEAGRPRLEEALGAVPWLLEHYLRNEALRELFPWGEPDPHQHFTNLLLKFTILRVLLLSRAAAQEEILSPQQLADIVQVFCRRHQTGKKIIELIPKDILPGDWTAIGRLFTLL